MPRMPQARLHDGQLYRPLSVVDRPMPSGTTIRIITWETRCPECGRWFAFESAFGFPKKPRRRCDACRQQGKPAAIALRHKPLRYRNVGRKRQPTA